MAPPLGSPLRLLAHARLPAWSARACAAAPLCGSVPALRRARPARPPAAGRLLTRRSSTRLDSPLLPLLILRLSDLSFDYCPDVGYLLHVGLIVRIVSFRGAAPMVAVRAVAAAAVGSDQRTISGKFAKLKEQGKVNHLTLEMPSGFFMTALITLMWCDEKALEDSLCKRVIVTRNENIVKTLDPEAAKGSRDAVAKIVY